MGLEPKWLSTVSTAKPQFINSAHGTFTTLTSPLLPSICSYSQLYLLVPSWILFLASILLVLSAFPAYIMCSLVAEANVRLSTQMIGPQTYFRRSWSQAAFLMRISFQKSCTTCQIAQPRFLHRADFLQGNFICIDLAPELQNVPQDAWIFFRRCVCAAKNIMNYILSSDTNTYYPEMLIVRGIYFLVCPILVGDLVLSSRRPYVMWLGMFHPASTLWNTQSIGNWQHRFMILLL